MPRNINSNLRRLAKDDLRIYNIFTRYFNNPSEWYDITLKAKEMGFNAIYLNPINKIGSSGSLYSIDDYFDWNKEVMGDVSKEEGEKELKAYLKKCKELGMHVFYDLVVNHTAFDSRLVKEHDDWYLHDKEGNVEHAFCYSSQGVITWYDSAKLDYNETNIKLYKYIESICKYYLKLGFTGFRCDAACYVPTALWNYLIRTIHEKYPDVIFLAESFMVSFEKTVELAKAGFEYVFDSAKWWNGYDSWFEDQVKMFHKNGYKLISFPDNHDTARLMQDVNGNINLYRERIVFTAFCSSSFEITYGFEYGFKNKPHVINTTSKDIEKTKYDFSDEIKALNLLRSKYEVLRAEGDFKNIWLNNTKCAFIEKTPINEKVNQKAFFIINKTNSYIEIPSSRIDELFVGECIYKSDNSKKDNEFEPYGIHVYIAYKDEKPCIDVNQSQCLIKKKKFIRKTIEIQDFFQDEALIEIKACGICGSDRREFMNGRFFWSGEEKGGHEFVGKVIQVGKKCKNVKVGDMVINRISRDREGVTQFGGYSKYAVVKENCLFVLPNNVNNEIATLIEPLACAVHIGNMYDNINDKRIAIVGSGTIALLTERYLKYVYPNAKIDFLYKHKEICKFLNPKTNPFEFNKVFSSNMFEPPKKYDLIMECSGNASIFSKLFNILADNGTILLCGIYNDSLLKKGNNLSLSTMMFRETSIQGSFLYTKEDFSLSADLILNKTIDVSDIITTMNFDDIQKAFLIPSSERVKIVLTNY